MIGVIILLIASNLLLLVGLAHTRKEVRKQNKRIDANRALSTENAHILRNSSGK